MANITLTLTGEDTGLSDALDEVAQSASRAQRALSEMEGDIRDIAGNMQGAATQAENLKENLQEIAGSSGAASSATSKLERTIQDTTAKGTGLTMVLDDVTQSEFQAAGGAAVLSSAFDQVEEQGQEADNAISKLAKSVVTEAAIAGAGVAPNLANANAIDKMGDEAGEARNKMAGAASMAELLSLKSSALSINVGAFTIALRNLTTQVPILVASLGNLASAFAGVAGAIGAVGVGGLAAGLGGAVAHAEEIAGPMATMEEKMQAMSAIAKEFSSMLNEAIEPLKEMEGSVELFKTLLEEVATTVNVFSQSIADSYENGPLREAIGTISDAWMESIVAIGDSFEIMIRRLEAAGLFEVIANGIRAFDDFVIFVTGVMEDMIAIMGQLNEGSAIQDFFVELMQLGRQVASGLAPLLGKFLDVVGSVAEEITALGSESIGAAVQIGALALAFNKLLAISGSVIQPLSLFAGHLTAIAGKSSSAGEAFVRMSGKMTAGLKGVSSGFASMSRAISTAIPGLTAGTSDAKRLAKGLNNSGSATKEFSDSLASLSKKSPFSRLKSSVTSLGSAIRSDLSSAADVAGEKLVGHIQKTEQLSSGAEYVVDAKGFDKIREKVSRFKSSLSNIPGAGIFSSLASSASTFRGKLIKLQSMSFSSAIADGMKSARNVSIAEMQALVRGVFDKVGQLGNLDIPAKIDAPFERASNIDFAGKFPSPLIPSSSLTIPDIDFRNMFTGIGSVGERISSLTPTLDGMRDSINSNIGVMDQLTVSNARTALSVEGVTKAFGKLVPTQAAVAAESIRTSKTMDEVTDNIQGLVGVEGVAEDKTGEVAQEMRQLAMSADLSDDQLEGAITRLTELVQRESLAGMTTEELSDELQKMGLSAQGADAGVKNLNDEIDELTIRQSLAKRSSNALSAATSRLRGVMGSLAIVTGGALAAFAAVLAVVGTVAAALMVLGDSGESADSIITKLKNSAKTFANIVQPLVVELGNTMIDIFNGIRKPIGALIDGFTEIGIALGLIDPSESGGRSLMSMFKGFVSAIQPVVDMVGLLALYMGEVLAEQIKTVVGIIAELIEALKIAALIDIVAGTIKTLTKNFGEFAVVVKFAAKFVSDLISGIIKIGAIAGTLAIIIGVLAGAVTVLNGSLAITTILSWALLSPIYLTYAAIIALVAVVIVALERFGILNAILSISIEVLSVLVTAFAKVGAILTIFAAIVAAAIAVVMVLNLGLTGTLALLIGITSPISLTVIAIGALIAALVVVLDKFGILDAILNALMGTVKAFVGAIVWMAKAIGGAIDGLIGGLKKLWNDTLGGQTIIPAFEIPGIPKTGFDGIDFKGADIPPLDSGGGGGGSSSGSSGSSGGDGGGDSGGGGSDLGLGSLGDGFEVMGGIGGAGKEAAMGGPASNVEYNEGDTNQQFNQDISADPKDKSQMSRIAKDAMKEANSFARRQQGGQ